MRTLCIDQGSTRAGYAIGEESESEISPGLRGRILDHGVIVQNKDDDLYTRITIFKADARHLIISFKVEAILIENTFFFKQKNAHSNQAMAALNYACEELAREFNIPIYKVHPGTAKRGLTGNGNADKEQVQKAVLHYTGFSVYKIKCHNHSDALGLLLIWLMDGSTIRSVIKK